MNTYIDNESIIPLLLEAGWTIKNNTWTNCPLPAYNELKKLSSIDNLLSATYND